MSGMTFLLKYTGLFFQFIREGENVSEHSVLRNCWQNIMRDDKDNAIFNKGQQQIFTRFE